MLLASSAGARLTQQEIARLDRGEIITHYWKLKGTNIGTGKAIGRVDGSPEQVFAIIADVNRYKEYMNRVVQSRITHRAGNHYYFYYKINMPWPLSDHWFVTRNIHRLDRKRREYRRSWTLDRGSFAKNDGYWQVRPWRGRTLATYSVVLQPRSAVPQFVINHVTKRSLPGAITNLRSRIAQLGRRTTR